MKKKYISPATQVYNVEVKNSLLEYSVREYGNGGSITVSNGDEYEE